MSGESSSSSNEQPNPQAEQWDSLMVEEVDQMHPREEGESKKEYKKRLQDMHKKTEAYLQSEVAVTDSDGKYTEKFKNSKYHQKELDAEAKAMQMVENINQRLQAGEINQETADRMKARVDQFLEQRINDIRQAYADPNTILEEDWIDSDKTFSRDEALAEQGQIGADSASTIEQPDIDEAAIANQGEESATSEVEKTGTYLEDAENAPISEIEALMNKQKAIVEQSEAILAGSESEKDLADETEKEAALEAEKEAALEAERVGTYLEDEEDLSIAEAEARIAELEASMEHAEALQAEEDFDIDAIVEKIDQRVEDARVERIKELEGKLDELRPDLAELYAKNRRLIVFPKTRAEFVKAKGEYSKLMDEYLKLQAEDTYESGKNGLASQLKERFDALKEDIESQLTEFAGGDLENTDKSEEEIDDMRARLLKTASDALKLEWQERTGQLETEVNAKFLESFLEETNALEDATIEQLDNGTLCRKVVSKIISNKYLKGVLIGAGVAGLAVTGVGLAAGIAAGTASIGFGLTAGGAATGAARGAFAGALMSRQDSKNSAIRNFADEEDIKNQLKEVNVLDQNSDTANVTNWLLDQYETAKDTDLSSNRKRTAISAGVGAALGALLSGVQINHVTSETQTVTEQVGTTPTEYQYQAANLDNVNIPEGHGISTTFQQLGGNLDDPAAFDQFRQIVDTVGNNYGLVPGDNGMVGSFAHTYPGTIDTWPAEAQAYITEVANEAARQGLIPSNTTVIGGQAIYGPVTHITETVVPDAFMNLLAQATAATGIGAGAGLFAGRQNRTPETSQPASEAPVENPPEPAEPLIEENPPETPPETPPEESEPESTPEVSEPVVQPEPSENPPAEPEPEPEPESTTEQSGENSPDADYRALVVDSLGGFLDDTGIEIMTRRLQPDADSSDITNWWDTLSDEAKLAVIQFNDSSNPGSLAGSAIREWIFNHPNQVSEIRGNNQS